MAKEDLHKLIEMLNTDEGLRIRMEKAISKIGQIGSFDEKNMETVFSEEILPLVKEKGLEIELSDMDYYTDGKLNDDELEAVTGGGVYSPDGYLQTTVGYSCSEWRASEGVWYGAKGCCGSCSGWSFAPGYPIFDVLMYVGFTGDCGRHRAEY